ncbi:MAG: homoserine dehydrogenase [Anaerolineaceae bacterium]|jgi:homoserine dehydrogenase|nr:homoserine dehydrogenase [Anaerolineaceae bacterium]MDD4043246.1 homoserine dehydrogenase [Anaerolineaceae bacterium]MDD4577470.1 homoserine dehydrogenase [Anaerolineaceae bacterium]
MKTIDLALLGFGNVGKTFARLLIEKKEELQRDFNFLPRITAIATQSHGVCINSDGIDEQALLSMLDKDDPIDLSFLDNSGFSGDTYEFIRQVPAQLLFETTPVNPRSGLPALDYLRAGAKRGLHLVTANKGPVVYGYRELTELTGQHGRLFRFESAVMDGAPIFSLFRGPLAGAQLHGFYGILNSCTNLLLDRMRNGETLEEAIVFGASIGITETDPSNDVDGWDAAIKVAALSNVLLGQNLTPMDVRPTGIRGITPQMIALAEAQGKRWKLVCQGGWKDNVFQVSVKPEMIGSDSPLYTVDGTSSYVSFELDVLPGLGILESNPSPKTTAFGLLSDLIDIAKSESR